MNEKQLKKVDEHVGKQLRSIRTQRGYSQEGLAAEVGLTFQQLQKYEYGRNRISASRMFQFSEILQIPPSFFFKGLPHTEEKPCVSLNPQHVRLLKYYDAAPPALRKAVLKLLKSWDSGAA